MAIYDDLIDKQERTIRHELGERDLLDALQSEIVALVLARRAGEILPTAQADLAEAEQHLPKLQRAYDKARAVYDPTGKRAQRLRHAQGIGALTDEEQEQIDDVFAQEIETRDARDVAKVAYREAKNRVDRLPPLIAALESIAGAATPTIDELLGALERK